MADSDDNKTPVLNFRCPENIEKKIAAIGLEFYPKKNKIHAKGKPFTRAYDVSQTILTIIEHGIDSINNDGIRTIDKTTQQTTEDVTALRAAIADQDLQIKRLQGLIFNAPIDLAIENERPFFTLDERVKYLELELGELKKGQRNRVTAIALQTIPVDDVELISPEPLPLLDELEKATDNAAIAVSTIPVDNLAITPEKTIDNAPKTDETNNQDDLPITDTEELKGLNNAELARELIAKGIETSRPTISKLKADLLAGAEITSGRLEKIQGWELREDGLWYKK